MSSFSTIRRAATKAGLLLSLLPTRPHEFLERVSAFMDYKLEHLWTPLGKYKSNGLREAISELEIVGGKMITPFLEEPAAVEIQKNIQQQVYRLSKEAPFPLFHNTDYTTARLFYAICRTYRPSVVLETGVAYGVTSAFILKALELNQSGVLHSVDLPPLGRNADDFIGILVPPELKKRWKLYRNTSRTVLPALLPKIGNVDIFIHDSLHTYRNISWELQTVSPFLSRQALVIADDIEGNHAFKEWVEIAKPSAWVTFKEPGKESICGISLFQARISES